MTIASDLLQRHIQTLVEDNAQWQTLIADDLVWELPYAPAIGHPARLSGREEVVRHVSRSGSGSRRSQGGSAYQAYGAYLSPGLCAVPACCRRQDRVPTRIFRSRACGQGAGHADSWSRVLRTSGDEPDNSQPPLNQALHLTGAAILVSRDIKLSQRPRQVSLVVRQHKERSREFVRAMHQTSHSFRSAL